MSAGLCIGPDKDSNLTIRIAQAIRASGDRAEVLLERYDVGLPRKVVRFHIDWLTAILGGSLWDDRPRDATAVPRGAWDLRKSLRYAAGASMLSARFRHELTADNLRRALSAKACFGRIVDPLDDLLDEGLYTVDEAYALHRHALEPITADSFDASAVRERIASLLHPRDQRLADVVASAVTSLRRAIWESPNGSELAPLIEAMNARLANGQALTMLQKEPTLDVRRLRSISAGLSAPDPDLSWQERFASHISHVVHLTILDMCFTNDLISPRELEAHLRGWYYFDAALTLLQNTADTEKDLRSGRASVFLLAARERDLIERRHMRGYQPRLRPEDWEAQLERVAELTQRGIAAASSAYDDATMFYPFIMIMIPAVLTPEWVVGGDDRLESYLRRIAPILREAVAAQPDAILDGSVPCAPMVSRLLTQ